MHKGILRKVLPLAAALLLAGCEPSDRRPGLWLSGNEPATLPADWSFTDEHREIHVEVATPYLLPHSVTIWCAQVDGTLYLGASAPETKNWPGWVDDDPEVRLEIDDVIYPVRLEPLTDSSQIAPVARAYADKYQLEGGSGDPSVGQRYWKVVPRA